MSKKGETTKKIYDYIKSHILEKGYPPSYREMGDAVGLSSTNTVHTHVHKLLEKGVISMEDYKPRTIRILREFVK
jgi:repressor LexA